MLKSTIMSKIVVALTGAFMIVFLIGHTLGNSLIYLGQDALNAYGAGLRENPELLWGFRIALIVAVVLHIVFTIRLNARNKAANPDKYAVKKYQRSTFSARMMVLAGLTIMFFVAYHLAHYTFHITGDGFATMVDELGRHDVYNMVIQGFNNPFISLAYILAMLGVGLHLNHGVQSMIHTLGINGDNVASTLKKVGTMFTMALVIILTSIPISVYLGFIGGSN